MLATRRDIVKSGWDSRVCRQEVRYVRYIRLEEDCECACIREENVRRRGRDDDAAAATTAAAGPTLGESRASARSEYRGWGRYAGDLRDAVLCVRAERIIDASCDVRARSWVCTRWGRGG